jgi:hypothetical protein
MSLLKKFKQLLCRHEFDWKQLGRRSNDGVWNWSCRKCGRVFSMKYGQKAPGKIVGATLEPKP